MSAFDSRPVFANTRPSRRLSTIEKPMIRKAVPDDLEALLPLVAAYHDFEDVGSSADGRRRAVAPLLNDPSLGAVWCIEGPQGLVGYLALCFGYSIEFGGRDAFVDEFFILPEARGQGLGGRLLEEVKAAAAGEGILALHLEVERRNEAAQRIYARHGFQSRAPRFDVAPPGRVTLTAVVPSTVSRPDLFG